MSDDSEVLDDLKTDKSLRKQEAEYYTKMGDSYAQEGQYRLAVKAYRKALDLDPSLDSVRSRYQDALTMVSERVGEVKALSEDLRAEVKVSKEQRLQDISRYIANAEKALGERRMAEAESSASKAVDAIAAEPDFDPAQRQAAQNLLKRIRDSKRLLEERDKARTIQTAQEKANADLLEENKLKERQVQELLRKSMDLLRLRDYERTVEVCERVLQLDPENLVAKFWLTDAKDQIVKQRRFKLITDRIENQSIAEETFAEASIPYNEIFVFPERDAWNNAVERSKAISTISTEDPEWVRRIKNSLEGTKVNFVFENTPLDEVVQQLRTFTGVAIIVDNQIDSASQTVTMSLQGLSAANALNLILDNVGLKYTFKENVLFITNQEGQKGGTLVFNIYNVSDLLNKINDFEGPELMLKPQGEQGGQPIQFTSGFAPEEDELDPEALMQLVKESAGGVDVWEAPNSIEYHNGQFLVEAPRELHAQLQTVLLNLRKDSDLFVVIEARFIDVNDDFLEDIGVDSRALGKVNNYGIPFGQVINDNRTGGQDIGFTESGNPLTDPELVMGQDRWAGRIQHIIDGFTGTVRGDRLSGGSGIGGLTLQATWLEPWQVNVIFRAVQERQNVRQLTAPVVTAHNGQRVYVSVITQRAYIADYNLVSGGTGFAIIEVADPEVQTFQEGVILDVDPVISHDKKYITLDVKPTLATLIGGVISTILISLGSFTNVAFQVPIGVPEISLQQSFTSVTVPNGGTVLLGGFKSLNEAKYKSYFPILGAIPLFGKLFQRKATVSEKRSLVILITARIVDLRGEETQKFNIEG